MTDSFFVQFASVFTAGLLTSVSPCVYPTLPLTVGFLSFQSKSKSKWPVILFFLGQTVAYVALGFVAVKLGEVFGFTSTSPTLNLILGLGFLAFALVSLTGVMPSGLVRGFQRAQTGVEKLSGVFKLAPFFIGLGGALIASPCTSPVLGGVLVSVAREPWSLSSLLLMIGYGVGASLLILLLGLGLVRASNLPRSGQWLNHLHKVVGILLLAVGFYYVYRAQMLGGPTF